MQGEEEEEELVLDNGSGDRDEHEDKRAHQFDPHSSNEDFAMSDDTDESGLAR